VLPSLLQAREITENKDGLRSCQVIIPLDLLIFSLKESCDFIYTGHVDPYDLPYRCLRYTRFSKFNN